MCDLLLRSVAAGLAGIWEIGMPHPYLYVAEMTSEEMTKTFQYYMGYKVFQTDKSLYYANT